MFIIFLFLGYKTSKHWSLVGFSRSLYSTLCKFQENLPGFERTPVRDAEVIFAILQGLLQEIK